MEIAPIPGIRALPAAKTRPAEFRLSEVFDLEGPARPAEGQEQRNGRKAAGAEEDDDDLLLDAEPEESRRSGVDYFA